MARSPASRYLPKLSLHPSSRLTTGQSEFRKGRKMGSSQGVGSKMGRERPSAGWGGSGSINALQNNLAASLQKSLPLLPPWALSPTSVKQRMFRKPSPQAPTPGMRRGKRAHNLLWKTQGRELVPRLSGTLGTATAPFTSPSSRSTN